MSKDKEKETQRPRVIAAVYVVNKEGKILLIHSPKWKNKLVPPGGHVNHGELPEQAAVRELKEETGLEVKNLELLKVVNIIDPDDFTPYEAHFIGFQFKGEMADEGMQVLLDGREASDYKWLNPEAVVGNKEVEATTEQIIREFFVDKKKPRKIFSKKCKNCKQKEKETEEFKAGWQRALADYKNLQREVEEKRSEWVKYSEQQILEEFIPVYDNFKKAIDFTNFETNKTNGDTNNRHWENWLKGVECIMRQFGDVLETHGVEEVKTVGEEFNPELHEAVGEEESDEVKEGKIVREVEAGYKMGEKVIKPAKVAVSK